MPYQELDETRVKLIKLLTKKNALVFDPFSQCGETKQAALFSERQFIDIEEQAVDLLLTEMPLFDFKANGFNYLHELKTYSEAIRCFAEKLKQSAYIALIVADQRYQGQYYCRHSDVIQCLDHQMFTLQGLVNVIQDGQALKSYGYPSTYVPNLINQFVIIAKKR